MQGYYEIDTAITASHRLDIRLPDTIPPGPAKVTIIYDVDCKETGEGSPLADFLNKLPEPPAGGMKREEIQAYIETERKSWDE